MIGRPLLSVTQWSIWSAGCSMSIKDELFYLFSGGTLCTQVSRRADTLTFIYMGQFKIVQFTYQHVFGRWEGAGVPRENPQ